MTSAVAKRNTSAHHLHFVVESAHRHLVSALTRRRPWPIPINPHPLDFADHSGYCQEVLAALSGYLIVILDDAAQNVPGGLDLRQIDALLCDLTSEVSGAFQNAAAGLPGRLP